MNDMATLLADRTDWKCPDCQHTNTCWCNVCHGCNELTRVNAQA